METTFKKISSSVLCLYLVETKMPEEDNFTLSLFLLNSCCSTQFTLMQLHVCWGRTASGKPHSPNGNYKWDGSAPTLNYSHLHNILHSSGKAQGRASQDTIRKPFLFFLFIPFSRFPYKLKK